MEKIRRGNFFKDNRFVFLAFACSAAIMLVVYMCFKVFPFGDITILRMDLYHQYGPLFAELSDKIRTGGSLFYSWETGLGSSFLGNYFNYLSSPIGFLAVLISGHENVPEAIAAMVLIKAALSALTMSVFLKKSQNKSNYVTVAFSILYSFCGWFIAYYWNIMWVDAMVLLPLIALGIERIIRNGKPALYIFALCSTMLSNYYMSYMMCIFSVLYFLVFYFSNYSISSQLPYHGIKKEKGANRFLRSGFLFALSSIFAAGLMAFALLPTFQALQQTSATSGTFPSGSSFYFSMFDFICNHLASVEPTIRSSGDDVMPNVYCGILTLMLLPLYLFTKSISKKEKALHIVLLAVFFISFNLNTLNYIWHGFHFPNDLPYRQSFMYSFLLVLIAFKTFVRLKEIPNRYILFSAIGVLGLCVAAEKLESKNIQTISLAVSMVFVCVYALLLKALKDKKYQTIAVSVVLLCCICSEAIISNTPHYSMDQPKTNYASDYKAFREVKNYIDEVNTDQFYRMELTWLRTRMDNAWYGYNGVSTFSSMAYEKLSGFQKSLGMYGNNINSYTYNAQTAVYNALFGLKYIVNNKSDSDIYANSDRMKKIFELDKYKVYQNADYLPVAYCSDSAVTNFEANDSDPLVNQNFLFESLTGEENVIEKIYPYSISYSNVDRFTQEPDNEIFSFRKTDANQQGTVTYYFETTADTEVYFYVKTSDEEESTLTVVSDLESYKQNLNRNYPFIFNIGKQAKNQTVTVSVPVKSTTGTITIYAGCLDNKKLSKGLEKLKAGGLNYDVFTDTLIEGSFYAEKNQVLATTIPYDEGWEIKIDGKDTGKDDIIKIGDSLIGLNVSKGYHEISLKFTPKGFRTGIYITVLSLAVLFALIVITIIKKVRKKGNHFDKTETDFDCEVFIKPVIEIPESTDTKDENNRIKCEIITPAVFPTENKEIPEIDSNDEEIIDDEDFFYSEDE